MKIKFLKLTLAYQNSQSWPRVDSFTTMKVSQLNLNQVKVQIQNPTAYISIGRKSKKNFKSPNQNLRNLIYAIQDSKASIRRQQQYTRSVHKGFIYYI